jgi:hypothetical protein
MPHWVRNVILVPVGISVVLAAGCAARYGLLGFQVEQDTIPKVRAEADQVRSLASSLGLVEVSRGEMRGWFDPFCQVYVIPANRVSAVTSYRLPSGDSSASVLERYHSALEARGWSVQRGVEYGLSEGWRGRYRVQTTAESRPSGTLMVEVRNEDRYADGCFK